VDEISSHKFLKSEDSLEPLNMIFGIGSPKGVFGQGVSDLPGGSLTGVSRS